MRNRRLKKTAAHLEITAFINLIVVLVPFLLSTAVFTRLAVIDLALPAQSSDWKNEVLKDNNLKLEIVVRPDSLEVGDKIGGLIQRIPNTPAGYDLKTLNGLVAQLKMKFPDKTEATLLAQPNTPYDTLVQIMDAVRTGKVASADGLHVVRADFFPDISIGDAPIKTPVAMK